MKKLFIILMASICLTGCKKENKVNSGVDTETVLIQRFYEKHEKTENQHFEFIKNDDGTYILVEYVIKYGAELFVSYFYCWVENGEWKMKEVRYIN